MTSAASAREADAPRRVGMIEIDIVDIYAKGELEGVHDILRYVRRGINVVHSDTRHYIIRRELLFDIDDPVLEKSFKETERNLRALGFLTNVSVSETGTLDDGRSVVTVRVQETWSLTTQVSLSRASGRTRWGLLLADTNFLGYGVNLNAGLGRNEDHSFSVLNFQNRRILGSPLRFGLTRMNRSDGHYSNISLDKPYYTQDTGWGFGLNFWDGVSEPRFYLDAHDLGGPATGEALYAKLPIEDVGLRFSISRRMTESGRGAIVRVGVGGTVSDHSASVPADIRLSDGRVIGGAILEAAENRALERVDGLALRPMIFLEAQGRHWTRARNVLRMGPVEDLLLDPHLRLSLGMDLEKAGDGGQVILEGLLQDWSRVGGGHLFLSLIGEAGFGDWRYRYHSVQGLGGLFLPHGRRRTTRVFFEAAHGANMLGTRALVLGLSRGMRTLGYDGRVGDRLLRWNVEHRLRLPGEMLGLYNTGVAIHYSGGAAWWAGDGAGPGGARHEAGIGLRLGPSRSAEADIVRIDLTWPLDGSSGPKITATTSGRF